MKLVGKSNIGPEDKRMTPGGLIVKNILEMVHCCPSFMSFLSHQRYAKQKCRTPSNSSCFTCDPVVAIGEKYSGAEWEPTHLTL